MILKNIWLFPIAYCDAAEPWHLMAPANQVYPFATTFWVNQSHSMIDRYLHQNLVQ
jgi:hypothetical protein